MKVYVLFEVCLGYYSDGILESKARVFQSEDTAQREWEKLDKVYQTEWDFYIVESHLE